MSFGKLGEEGGGGGGALGNTAKIGMCTIVYVGRWLNRANEKEQRHRLESVLPDKTGVDLLTDEIPDAEALVVRVPVVGHQGDWHRWVSGVDGGGRGRRDGQISNLRRVVDGEDLG